MKETQISVQYIVELVLEAVAVGMSVTSIVLGYFGVVGPEVQVNLLAIGLFTLSVAALQKRD